MYYSCIFADIGIGPSSAKMAGMGTMIFLYAYLENAYQAHLFAFGKHKTHKLAQN